MNGLRRALAVDEVEASPQLRFLLGTQLFFYFLSLWLWGDIHRYGSSAWESFDYVPLWPAEHLPFLFPFPAFAMRLVLELLALASLGAVLRLTTSPRCTVPMGLLLVDWSVKLYVYLGDMRQVSNFSHVHLLLSCLFLFTRQKLFFFRVGLALIYVMAAVAKMTPSWLWGEYFNSIPDALPFFPLDKAIVTGAGLTLMALELLGPLCWLSSNRRLRYGSVAMFLLFHYYSGFIVGHFYTTLMLPTVVGAFLSFDAPMQQGYRLARRDAAAWLLVALCLAGSVANFFIPGDVRTTAEGRYVGLFMFDANRRVRATIDVIKGDRRFLFRVLFDWPQHQAMHWDMHADVTVYRKVSQDVPLDASESDFVPDRQSRGPWEEVRQQSLEGPFRDRGVVIFNAEFFTGGSSRMFGDPYLYYYYGRELIRRYGPDRLSIRLEQQLDGHEESVRVLDIADFARLDPHYNPFGHNDWIALPGANAPDSYRWP